MTQPNEESPQQPDPDEQHDSGGAADAESESNVESESVNEQELGAHQAAQSLDASDLDSIQSEPLDKATDAEDQSVANAIPLVSGPQASGSEAEFSTSGPTDELTNGLVEYSPEQYAVAPSQEPIVLPPVVPIDRLRYLQSYYFIFDNPNWILTLAVGFLCIFVAGFVPLAPYILFGGYLVVVLESLIYRSDETYPVFTFDYFSHYFTKAVWPFLVSLPFLVIFAGMYLVSYFGGLFGLIALSSTGDEELIGLSLSIGLPIIILGGAAVVAFLSTLATTMMLRSALTGSFVEALRFRWIFSYIQSTWLEHILAHSFLMTTSIALSVLGLFACCIGTYFAQAYSMMAYTHLTAQMYRLYVTRGGTPIAVQARI